MEELKELVRMSNEIGKFKDLVQSGGGNTSIKTMDGKMLIKASGFTFSEMTEKSGFAIIDYNRIIDFFENYIDSQNAEENENRYNTILTQSMVDVFSKPSIETGMHVFLDQVVIHTHPVMANIVNCMNGGEKLARQLFSENSKFLWVDYKNPGYNLAKEIKKQVASYESKNGAKPEIIFLKNHGLIISGNNSPKCADMTINVNKTIYDYLKNNFGIEDFSDPLLKLKDDLHINDSNLVGNFVEKLDENKWLLSQFLIPDDVVYCSEFSIQENLLDINKITFVAGRGVIYPWDENKSSKINEMLTAKLYIISALQKIGKIDFLKEEDVRYILNMESEKYRQKLN